jgi:hypothetical protein
MRLYNKQPALALAELHDRCRDGWSLPRIVAEALAAAPEATAGDIAREFYLHSGDVAAEIIRLRKAENDNASK